MFLQWGKGCVLYVENTFNPNIEYNLILHEPRLRTAAQIPTDALP